MLRIAIANDRADAVEILRKLVLSVPGYEIAWIAASGAEAVRKCAAAPPDLILMELDLPQMNGVQATRMIMTESPCAILIVTPKVSDNAGKIFEAMGYGALDVVATPAGDHYGNIEGGQDLLEKIARLSKLVINGGYRKKPASEPRDTGRPPLVAIGSSAGGPKALATILKALPGDYSGSIVIVQHIDSDFAPRLVDWLSRQTSLAVRLVEQTSPVSLGTVFVAGSGKHLVMTHDHRLAYHVEPVDLPYSPSIDVFFSSAAICWPEPGLAILLTGMGKDGAKGLLNLRRAGWHTIAQDESSSVVYGMPRAAAALGAAVEVLSLSGIIAAISEHAAKAHAEGHIQADAHNEE